MSESWIPPRARHFLALVAVVSIPVVISLPVKDFGLLFVAFVLLTYDSYHEGYEDGIKAREGA